MSKMLAGQELEAVRTFGLKDFVKVSHKGSSAVAYLYAAANGEPAARLFCGKRGKPDSRYYYNSEAQRTREIEEYFANVQRVEDAKAAEKKAGHSFQIGDIVYTSWGYDQTNIDFFQVVGVTAGSVKMRAIAQEKTEEGWCRGKCTPVKDRFIGGVFTARVSGDFTRAEGHTAFKWDGKPKSWTAYA
jgi:hypothetical protein